MQMGKESWLGGLLVSAAIVAVSGQALHGETYKVEVDKPDGLYQCGETATFTVRLLETNGLASSGQTFARLDNFGTSVLTNMPFDAAATGVAFMVRGTLREPGFLRLSLPPTNDERKDPSVFSVGFEPERIRKGSPSPADFDEFWAESRARLAREVPLDARMDKVSERCTADFDFYRISFATFGRRVHGYMSVPADKSKAPFPVDFEVSAAGFGDWTNDMQGDADSILVKFSVYPFAPDWNWRSSGLEATYKAMDADLKARYGANRYCQAGISESREAYFFHPVILGIDRAVDWVVARPDVDRSRIRYQGTSQGGGFGFYLCGLNRAFTRAAFYVPALTDTMGYLAGRQSGWPQIVENNSGTPDRRASAEKWTPYFDAANFASRIKCPVRVAVGFSDVTCPPCAVYAAYNEINVADKAIGNGIGMTHSCSRRLYDEYGRWIKSSAETASATDMDHKGRVIATVETKNAGTAEVTCNDLRGWTICASASQDAGRDVVTVRISSPTNAVPPQFGVFFRVPGAGVQNVWTSDFECDGCHVRPQLWWGWSAKSRSQLARDTPIAVGFNSQERSPVALACSEAFNPVEFGLYADDRTCEMVGRCEFFTASVAPLREYEASVMLDRRCGDFGDTVRQCTEWIAAKNGFRTARVSEAAFDPLYSTWYAYLQDVHAGEIEKEARLAASLGMKTMILDDGWQKLESRTFYSATGDWMPVPSRFPDMKSHVAAVHKAGLKYMLWLAVPYVGDESKAWDLFKDKALAFRGSEASPGKIAVLDPRFPEVREYLISTYERVVGEWGFDGVKLDFVDRFTTPEDDPAAKDGYAGRDYRSVPDAVDRLMKDILARLGKINPDVLVEFRQHYMGPAILQYGNMMRAADCPADPTANRKRICDLRLTSMDMAVHSDMLVWSRDESPEGAALPILNVLFSTIQYSMVLATVPPSHREVVRHWIGFSQLHRKALLQGEFRPHHPENGYTWIEGESAEERIVAVYANDVCVRTGAADKPVFLVNATGGAGMLVDFPAPCRVEFHDVFGKPTGGMNVGTGITRLPVPSSGYGRIAF